MLNVKASFQVVPELESSFQAEVHDMVRMQGVVKQVLIDGVTRYVAGTRMLEAGCAAMEPTWEDAVFAYVEAAAHAASALSEAKAETLLRESFAEFFGAEEKAEEDCVF